MGMKESAHDSVCQTGARSVISRSMIDPSSVLRALGRAALGRSCKQIGASVHQRQHNERSSRIKLLVGHMLVVLLAYRRCITGARRRHKIRSIVDTGNAVLTSCRCRMFEHWSVQSASVVIVVELSGPRSPLLVPDVEDLLTTEAVGQTATFQNETLMLLSNNVFFAKRID